MTGKQPSSTTQLLRASSDDQASLIYNLPDSSFGFHAQQAVEKLYKALIAHHTGSHTFSHDLLSLRKSVEACGETLPSCKFRLEELSEYAGNARYDEPMPLDEPTRELLRQCIGQLRAFVLLRLTSGSSGGTIEP